ncbi:MAG: hypothetical protein GXY36_20195 [Chloroflexi bacterium]|nr:hypothetical protein [Chloroflexota bacterium]
MPSGPNISYGYDAGGRRISQTIGSTTTSYLWDEFSPYGDIVYETDGTQTTSYVLAGSRLLSQTGDGATSYFLQDAQGGTRALIDAFGIVTDTHPMLR